MGQHKFIVTFLRIVQTPVMPSLRSSGEINFDSCQKGKHSNQSHCGVS